MYNLLRWLSRPAVAEGARALYFSSLFGMVFWIFLRTAYAPAPAITCTSRWEGEIVALRQDAAGVWYCNRVDYSNLVRRRRGGGA